MKMIDDRYAVTEDGQVYDTVKQRYKTLTLAAKGGRA